MLYWSIAATAALLLPILGLWPVKVTGDANQNTMWFIRMRSPEKQTQPHAAIFAQEVVEFWIKWVVAVILSAPVAYIARDNPNGWAFWVIAMMAGVALVSKVFSKPLELIGHAVEVNYARRYANVGDDYIGREARSMIRGYSVFKNSTEAALIAAMEKRMGLANFLTKLLWLRIKREA